MFSSAEQLAVTGSPPSLLCRQPGEHGLDPALFFCPAEMAGNADDDPAVLPVGGDGAPPAVRTPDLDLLVTHRRTSVPIRTALAGTGPHQNRALASAVRA